MKTAIHPQWYPETKVTCACGNNFTVGSTVTEIHVEVCSACHPFYTGEAKFIDTKGRVDRFRDLQARQTEKRVSKKEKRQIKRQQKIQEELSRPETLAQLRKNV